MAVDALFFDSLGNPLVTLAFGPLNADNDEVSEWAKVTVKMPNGYVSTGNGVIDGAGVSDAKFQLAADNAGAPADPPEAYGASLTTATGIDDTTGRDFWCRAKATSGESAQVDVSVSFSFAGEAIAE